MECLMCFNHLTKDFGYGKILFGETKKCVVQLEGGFVQLYRYIELLSPFNGQNSSIMIRLTYPHVTFVCVLYPKIHNVPIVVSIENPL